MFIKKGAMFGLDARIALAIFGALSVISGAALYSAIQQAKVVAVITDLNEVHKAFDQYWLDTGSELARISSGSLIFDAGELVDNSKNALGWNGPYLSYKKDSSLSYILVYPSYGGIQIYGRSSNDAWGGTDGVDGSLPSTCTGAAEPCGRWAVLSDISVSLAKSIDEYVDGAADYKNGNLRVYCTAAGVCTVYLLGPPAKGTA